MQRRVGDLNATPTPLTSLCSVSDSPRKGEGQESSHVHRRNTATPPRVEIILSVNNIEVIYDHVILVLKGVSLDVPRAASWRCSAPTAPARPPR